MPLAGCPPPPPRTEPCSCAPCRTQLRNKFKTNGQFYRVFPNGEVQYLHPKDGVYPEKVNAGRQAVNTNSRRIGANPNPIAVRYVRLPPSLQAAVNWLDL